MDEIKKLADAFCRTYHISFKYLPMIEAVLRSVRNEALDECWKIADDGNLDSVEVAKRINGLRASSAKDE